MNQKLDKTDFAPEASPPAPSPKQQAFNWDDGEMPEKSGNVEPAMKEPKRGTNTLG